MSSFLRLERKQNAFQISRFLFHCYSFGIETITSVSSYAPVVSSKIADQNGQSLYPFSDQNDPKNPTLWGGTYLYGLYEGVPPPGLLGGLSRGEKAKQIKNVVTEGRACQAILRGGKVFSFLFQSR